MTTLKKDYWADDCPIIGLEKLEYLKGAQVRLRIFGSSYDLPIDRWEIAFMSGRFGGITQDDYGCGPSIQICIDEQRLHLKCNHITWIVVEKYGKCILYGFFGPQASKISISSVKIIYNDSNVTMTAIDIDGEPISAKPMLEINFFRTIDS